MGVRRSYSTAATWSKTVGAAPALPSTVIFHSESWIGILRNQKAITSVRLNRNQITSRKSPKPLIPGLAAGAAPVPNPLRLLSDELENRDSRLPALVSRKRIPIT